MNYKELVEKIRTIMSIIIAMAALLVITLLKQPTS